MHESGEKPRARTRARTGMIVTGLGAADDRWTTASNDILALAHAEMGPIRALRAVQGLVGAGDERRATFG